MQKYLLALALLCFPLVAMYSEIPTDQDSDNKPILNKFYIESEQPTIVKVTFSADTRWYEIEAELSNGDVLTYTKFPHLNNASSCIHAKAVNSIFEKRDNASKYWHMKMENLYNEKTSSGNKKNILNIYN